MPTIKELLEKSAGLHQHLCPRQVLGVRIGLFGGKLLDLTVPQQDKQLLTVSETYGCATDGIAVATGCWVGRRTLRILDFGKVAATFIDTESGRAVRVTTSLNSRHLAKQYATDAPNRWQAYLLGYQRMPDDELLTARNVKLSFSLDKLLSKEAHRVHCQTCGEEITNEREITHEGSVMCRACAGYGYYQTEDIPLESVVKILPCG